MPLSKKRDKERKRLAKFQPKLDTFQPNDEFHWRDQGVQPIPNRPDGSHR